MGFTLLTSAQRQEHYQIINSASPAASAAGEHNQKQEFTMKEDNLKKAENRSVEVPSVANDDLPQRISDILNAFCDSRADDIEQIDLETEPVPMWRFKVSAKRKSN